MSEEPVNTPPTDDWAIVELMGHRQRAGRVSEVEKFGAKLLRIDMPCGGPTDGEGGRQDWVTEFYGGSAIYALRPCDEEIVRDWLRDRGELRPVRPLRYQSAPALSHDGPGFDEDDR